jgi:NDP-sugar pyrophosphorylase family protein
MTGAVLILGSFDGVDRLEQAKPGTENEPSLSSFSSTPVALLDVLGEPILHRIVESLRRRNVGPLILVVENSLANHVVVRDIAHWHVEVMRAPVGALSSTVDAAIVRAAGEGTRRVLAIEASAYVELNVAELVHFQRESQQRATFVSDAAGPLPIALIDGKHTDIAWPLLVNRHTLPRYMGDYEHRGYVNRLQTVAQLRTLAKDALLRKCQIRPNGAEVRSGVWIAESARIHPHARVVGPAYIGPYTKLRPGALISGHSVVERCCEIDRGTVVEESSILPYTYLGVCLDLADAVVKQNKLIDLKRNCVLEVSDTFIAASRVAGRTTLPSLLGLNRRLGGINAMRERLRSLLSRRPEPVPSTRVSYDAPTRRWSNLQPVPSTTEPRST